MTKDEMVYAAERELNQVRRCVNNAYYHAMAAMAVATSQRDMWRDFTTRMQWTWEAHAAANDFGADARLVEVEVYTDE